MNKVYIVRDGFPEYNIIKVFSSKNLADSFCEIENIRIRGKYYQKKKDKFLFYYVDEYIINK